MDDHKEKDAVRLLNQQYPIRKFLTKKEFWREVLNSPIGYASFLIIVSGGALLISKLMQTGAEVIPSLNPQLFTLATIVILTAAIGASSAFNLLWMQQLRKHLEIIQRAEENMNK